MENSLYHHGILGMKWGIRRYQNSDGTLTPEGKRRYSESTGLIKSQFVKSERKLNKKQVREMDIYSMSDEDLRKLLNRLQMQKQINDLSKEEVKNGRKVFDDISYYSNFITKEIKDFYAVYTIFNNIMKISKATSASSS